MSLKADTKKILACLLAEIFLLAGTLEPACAAVVDATSRVSVRAVVSAPEERNQAYFLSTEGEVFAVGGAPTFSPNPVFPGQDLARAFAVSPETRGYYILKADGDIIRFGDALPLGSGALWPGLDKARDIKLTPSGLGAYVLADDGDVVAFGDAVDLNPPLWIGLDRARALEVTPTGFGYAILEKNGNVEVFGDAIDLSASAGGNLDGILWPDGNPDGIEANDLVMTLTGSGYHILANTSEVNSFGDAIAGNNAFITGDEAEAKDIALSFLGQGYYIIENDATLYPLGDAGILNGLPSFGNGGGVTPPDPIDEPIPVDDPPSLGNIQKPLHTWANTLATVINDDNDNRIEFEVTYDMAQLIANVSVDSQMSANAHISEHLTANTLHEITYFWVVLYRIDEPSGYVDGLEGTGNQFIGGYYFGLFAQADDSPLRGILRVPEDFEIGAYRLDIKTRVGTFDFSSFFSPFVAYDTLVIDHFRPMDICSFQLVLKDNASLVMDTVPIRMLTDETRLVTIEMENTGTSPWRQTHGYILAGDLPADDVNLDPSDLILPNQARNFEFTITAPPTPGFYSSSWQMARENIHNFGQGVHQNIEVLDSSLDYPDLTVESLTAVPNVPAENDNVQITGVVRNQGTENAFNVEVVFYDGHPNDDGTQIGSSINLAGVLQGEAILINQNWTYPGGLHEIFMFLDPDDTIIESVEINNGASVLVPNSTAIMFVDDFEDADPAANLFGFWTGSNFLVFEMGDPDLTGNKILQMNWANQDDWWASVVWDEITPLDASGFDFLSFRIKALNSGENVTVKLEDSQGAFPADGIFRYELNNISTVWEDINIPLSEFRNDLGVSVDASQLRAIVLLFDAPSDGVGGTAHIDEVSFSEDPGI